MIAAIAIGSACAALAIGLALGLMLGRRGSRGRLAPRQRPAAGELANQAIRTAHNGIAILDEAGEVLLHNERAEALGVVTDNEVSAEARTAAEQAARTGGAVAVELSPPATAAVRAPLAVSGEARNLLDGSTVIDVSDRSELVRLEATRRDFIANVSHELKTPVGAMSVLAEALLDGAGEAAQVQRFAGKILDESNRLGRLVGELISLSRLEGAEQPPELAEVDLDRVVNEALHRCELAAEAHEIPITADEPSGLTVRGDHALLVTALANLLDNAVAYSPDGSAVSVSREHADGFAEVAITDRGIGIAHEHQQRVFERFYRVDADRSRATGGTGLGLAIVKHVAANHGGSVRVSSAPGSGSTFTVSVPATQTPSPVPPGTTERQEVS